MPENKRSQEKARRELRKVADEFLRTVKERVDLFVLLCDTKKLTELVQAVKVVGHYQLVEIIMDKGLSKEFGELCDKAGKVSADKKR